MGFKKIIDSTKALSLFTALTLLSAGSVMAQDTGAPAAPGAAAPDAANMWPDVIYYALIFLAVCFSVAILGKILKVYDLTSRMQGKKGINWNNIMGICCLVFLVAGMYGAYWSLTVQGSMKLPVAASAHGG